jgi:hypothetical protein
MITRRSMFRAWLKKKISPLVTSVLLLVHEVVVRFHESAISARRPDLARSPSLVRLWAFKIELWTFYSV